MQPEIRQQRRAARRAARQGEPVPVAAPAGSDQFALFRDIEVVPPTAFRLGYVLVDGGPVWPDFDQQNLARIMRRNRYVDLPVVASNGPHERITLPCVWGGFAIRHFGHLIADHLTRVLESRLHRPDDLMLFLLPPGGKESDLPAHFWALLDWYGVRRDRVRCVTGPLIVSELRCFAQAEPFESYGPSDRYLQLLAENAVQQGLKAEPAAVLYVGRMGLLAQGKGGAAGEGYLVHLLQRAGVRVLDPAKADLRAQLSGYAGAGVLIFAEGSALHGRQLLGTLDQRIVVLNRRMGARIAEAALQPRVRSMQYIEATAQVIGMGTLGASKHAAIGLSMYDLPAVFDCFAQFGIDLRALWDSDDYAAAVKRDAELWLSAHRDERDAVLFDLNQAVRALREAGVPVDFSVVG